MRHSTDISFHSIFSYFLDWNNNDIKSRFIFSALKFIQVSTVNIQHEKNKFLGTCLSVVRINTRQDHQVQIYLSCNNHSHVQ